jgi:uncharacterized protein YbjT (DUF2867 family)
MTSSDVTPYAVIGATGKQGGAVVDALLAANQPVRAVVRDPDSARSASLAARGVTLVHGDQDDPDSLTEALRGIRGLFFMTTFSDDAGGTDGETRRGRTVAQSAAHAGVPHVVYSSVGGAERHSGVPHFDSKRRVEEALTDVVLSSFVRPTFFMENLAGTVRADDSAEFVYRFPMPGDVPIQMVAVSDIGKVSAAVLLDPSLLPTGTVEIAGDVLTGAEIAVAIGRRLGKPARFEALPLSVLGDEPDRKAMFEWFVDTPAYQADFEATRRLDPSVLDLAAWLKAISL